MSELREPATVFAQTLGWQSALKRTDLLAPPVAAALQALADTPPGRDLAAAAQVVEIDPALSDTDALSAEYSLNPEATGNCVLVAGKRTGERRVAACVVRANDFADVNHLVKNLLDVRKASFLPMEQAVELSGMAYGGITPVGLPTQWRLLIDAQVAARDTVLIGSGVRHSKLLVPGALLAALPGAEVIEGLGVTPA
ncbi:YbaK/EbsC family protein [Actinomyces sp.]|uniref:YbaK/EbsC family protein n=1 Tax=Actinomyces sp. TaxID=29317 RepID=UPI0026DCAC97|nr:YbaK/EbsC family protein [Actinomyces sp.]MDO4899941.1 YbaK/EbsC family protein [Actinomyces sp.]